MGAPIGGSGMTRPSYDSAIRFRCEGAMSQGRTDGLVGEEMKLVTEVITVSLCGSGYVVGPHM
jgi:hypothetical protein